MAGSSTDAPIGIARPAAAGTAGPTSLFDRAFDRGLITFDESLRVVVSPQLQATARSSPLDCSLLAAHGRPLTLPKRFTPDPEALMHHRTQVFVAE